MNPFQNEPQKTDALLSFNLLVSQEAVLGDRVVRDFFAEIFREHLVIASLPITPSWQEELTSSELVRGVGGTIGIEGNTLTEKQIREAFEKADGNESMTILDREAVNSRDVYEFCFNWLRDNKDGEITIPLIREIHKRNTQGINYANNTPGEFRKGTREIGYPARHALLNNFWEIEKVMEAFVGWLNDEDQLPYFPPLVRPLIKSILAHYYLTEIHPFGDGNGRTARALEALLLLKGTGFNYAGFYMMANYCNKERARYIEVLGKVYIEEDPTPFVLFCLEGLLENLQHVRSKISEKIQQMVYMDYFREKEQTKRIKKREAAIVRLLISRGEIDFDEFIKENFFNVSLTTRYRYLSKLEREQLIKITKKSEDSKQKIIVPNYDVAKGLRLSME